MICPSWLGDPTPQRGGRAKRHYTLTPLAVRSLKDAQRDFVRLWSGSPLFARGRIVRDARMNVDREGTPTVYAIPTGRSSGMTVFAKLAARHDTALTEMRRDIGAALAGAAVSTAWWSDRVADLTASRRTIR